MIELILLSTLAAKCTQVSVIVGENLNCKQNVSLVVDPSTINNRWRSDDDDSDADVRGYEYMIVIKPRKLLYLDQMLPFDSLSDKPFTMHCAEMGDWKLPDGMILTIGRACHLATQDKVAPQTQNKKK